MLIPALIFVVAWSFIAPQLVANSVLSSPAAANLPEFGFLRDTMLNEAQDSIAHEVDALRLGQLGEMPGQG